MRKESTARSIGRREHIVKTLLLVGTHCAQYNAPRNENITAGIQNGSLTLLASSSRRSFKHIPVLPEGAQWDAGSKATTLL